MKVINLGGAVCVDSRLPSDTFNVAYGGEISSYLVKQVAHFYRKNGVPMAWWISPRCQEDLIAHYLLEEEFKREEMHLGMVADLSPFQQDLVSNVHIQRCQTLDTFKDFGTVLSSALDPIDPWVKVFYEKVYAIKEDERKALSLFVGYSEGRPVSTAALFLTDVAGIYDISTCPEERDKGYGSLMVGFVLREARKRGFKKAVLQASPDGLNLYKRFGFRETCVFNV